MKILQLGKFYPIRGGVEKVMYDIMIGLNARGVECDMMCAESDGSGSVRNIDSHARLLTYRMWLKLASTTIAPSMVAALRSIAADYDIIHVHHPDPMAAIALKMSGYKGKVVLHWHSDIIKNKPMLSMYLPLQEWLIERADLVVGTSPEYLASSPYLTDVKHKTLCIPIGIKPMTRDEKGAARIRQLYGDRKIVFSLGRLIPYKGFSHLIASATELPDDYVVVIGGEGPLKSELESLRDSLGLYGKVFLTGMLPQEDLAAYYTASHIFSLPSVMKTEAFGIVQIEAMSLGKPVVATRIAGSGTAWVNSHGESGLNVDVEDSAALAKAILTIDQTPQQYQRFSDGARKRFESLFTFDKMIDNCLDLYRRLI